MASQPEEEAEADPSELTTDEILALLYLTASDSEKEETPEKDPLLCHEENALDDRLSCHEEMASSDEDALMCDEILNDDDDEVCQNVLDRFERQRAFQTQLLEQSGGGLDALAGTFDFELQPYVDRQSSRLGVRERHFNTRLRQTGNFVDSPHVVHALQEGLRRAVNRVLTTTPNLHDEDRLYFTLSSNRLTSNFQGWGLRAGEWREGGARLDALFDRLAQALNSNEQFEMDDSFQLSITQVHHAPQGSGRPRRGKPGHTTMELLTKKSNSIIRIHNYNDDLCCARALVVAKARVDHHSKWESIRKGGKVQRELALLLHHEAQVPFRPCSYDALTKFSTAPSLIGYQILLVDADRSFHITTFGPLQDKQLILLHHHGHYDVITRLPGFFGSSYVCAHCWKPYNNEGKHRCNNKRHCRACCQKECPDFLHAYPRGLKATRRCQTCHRDFFGDTCFQMHLVKDHAGKPAPCLEYTICFRRRRCPTCLKLEVGWQGVQRHQCGYLNCPSCHEYVDAQTHRCFIQRALSPQELRAQKKKRKRRTGPRAERAATLQASEMDEETLDDDVGDDDSPPLHVFFDIEAMQPHEKHVPNLVVAETDEDDAPVRFPGPHCIRDFLEWLDTLTENDTRAVNVLAHNFQGYDGYFVVHQYHDDNRLVQQLRNGCKLLEVKHDRLRFIDSLSFFQMPLSAFPKTFGLTELKKGYFPHKFNVPDHQTYVGPVPALDYYMPDTLSPKDKQALETWHQEQRTQNVLFNFQQELVAYCESDVRLLKQGCLTFKRLFESLTGFNPFDHITIASACNRDLRMNRMIPHSIASEPVYGWRNRVNQSRVALEWLTWCDHVRRQESLSRVDQLSPEGQAAYHRLMADVYPNGPQPHHYHGIQHAGNAGEVRIPGVGFFVDGYCHDTNTVYEFHGCFWHGCPHCYPNRHEQHLRHCDRTMQDVYEGTQQRTHLIQALGYNVVQMWECEWHRLKDTSPNIRTFVESLAFTDPLNPRDAFCGGRTNAVKLYHRVTPGQQIHYIDVTSLYPWVNKTCVYPKGHPRFLSHPGHTDIAQYFGLIRCRVLPPRELYHPVLPYRYSGKLLFPLCARCVKEEMGKRPWERTAKCHHTDDQRALTGTWCSPELYKAVDLGYEVQYIYEVWHFDETCEGLFRDYVNTWLKIKQEASGWPSWVGDDETKRQQYLREYFEHEGIQLEYDKIEHNPGLRTLAKMMLNSMWGKFGQRLNKTQVQEFNDPQAFHRFLDTSTLDVRHVSVINDQLVEVHYQYQDEDIPVSPNLNIFVACFTTCWARLRLYEALQLLGERVLYYDTDSVFFLQEEGQPNPVLGDYLGEFTSELDPHDFIVEFVSAGPKNYGYQTKLGHVECKVRGFRLNTEGKSQLNYNVMRQNVLDEIQKPQKEPRQTQVVKTHQIVRDAKTYELYTFPDYKRYQLVYDKRVVDPNTFQTFPYGYQ